MEAIRAELRGLGAGLMIVSGRGIWGFRPDDELHLHAHVEELEGADVRDAWRAYSADAIGDGAIALFVIDGDGVLRFRHRVDDGADVTAMLSTALSAAGRALLAPRPPSATLSRRELVVASLAAAFALVLVEGCDPKAGARAPAGAAAGFAGDGEHEVDVVLDINGTPRPLRIETRVTLLDALRERLGLTGTKKGCDHGQCGACTVIVEGRRVNACLTLAVMAQGVKITTIEGLANGDTLHPLQAAFVSEDGFQCGYCTPGQIMSALGMHFEGHAQTDDEVREQMSGNICRCGAYPNIVAAVQLARKGMPR
jgi:xanthine dehydrogenase YagT iron-sulfur-binding subunit